MRWYIRYHCWDDAGNTLACGGWMFYHFPTDEECAEVIAELMALNPTRVAKIHSRIEKA